MLPCGMKTTGFSPAELAYAAIEADVFPVDTHATSDAPSCTACDAPHVIPLSLKDPVGLKPWCLDTSASSPPYSAARRPGNSGVQPSRSVPTRERSSRNGMNSRQRQTPLWSSGALEVRRARHKVFSSSADSAGLPYTASNKPPHRGQLYRISAVSYTHLT